jgi:hypothetical protein
MFMFMMYSHTYMPGTSKFMPTFMKPVFSENCHGYIVMLKRGLMEMLFESEIFVGKIYINLFSSFSQTMKTSLVD